MVPYVRDGTWNSVRSTADDKVGEHMNTHELYRVNIIDASGTASFLTPPHIPKALAAAVARGAASVHQLLHLVGVYDERWAQDARLHLAKFDEHNVDEISDDWQTRVLEDDTEGPAAFRVLDQPSRERSLRAAPLGLVVINLKDQRIIQVQNWYDELRRIDRGRIRVDGEPTDLIFHYELPSDWALVP